MRKARMILVFCVVSALLALTGASCSPKVGCPANEAAHVKPNRNGELPASGGKTQLFPKDFNKKVKRKRN
ncbi:MAG: hypothetical protein J5I94_27690 [Phaeodactylibacter sp.]|nr:hypothetical protein [Phaeodactylibacter sp.]